MKTSNEYAAMFKDKYDKIPKSVFAAVALSFAYINCEEKGFDGAVAEVLHEWDTLHQAGIVPQKPTKGLA
jgi:hypothetical protein